MLFLAVLMSTYLGFEARENQIASRKLVEHTCQVLSQLEVVFSLLKDAETGQRSYLLTANAQYLKPYLDAKAEFDSSIEKVRVLTNDYPAQKERIHELTLLSKQKFASMEKTIKARQSEGLDAALALMKMQDGRILMEDIRRLVTEMIDVENKLLKERSVQLLKITDKASDNSVFFSCLTMTALLICAYMLNIFVRATQKAENKLSVQYGIARQECDRLVRLINDILDLRKIESGMLELKKTTVETQELIKRTIDGIRGMAQGAQVELVAELNTGGPIFCDQDRIIQVLTNLSSNAIKFSAQGARVILSLSPGEGSAFRFCVKDHGSGIPANQMHKLFGKFQQLNQSDGRPKEGTGLGLAISKATFFKAVIYIFPDRFRTASICAHG